MFPRSKYHMPKLFRVSDRPGHKSEDMIQLSSRDFADVIKKNHGNANVSEIVHIETKRKILEAPENNIHYYDIPADPVVIDSHTKTMVNIHKYRSIHQPDDLKTLKNQQIKERGSHLNIVEEKARSDLKAKPGRRFLLGEIYDEFNNEIEGTIKSRKNKGVGHHLEINRKFQTQPEAALVETLDLWAKTKKTKAPRGAIGKNETTSGNQAPTLFTDEAADGGNILDSNLGSPNRKMLTAPGFFKVPSSRNFRTTLENISTARKTEEDQTPAKLKALKLTSIKKAIIDYKLSNSIEMLPKDSGVLMKKSDANEKKPEQYQVYYDSLPSMDTLRSTFYTQKVETKSKMEEGKSTRARIPTPKNLMDATLKTPHQKDEKAKASQKMVKILEPPEDNMRDIAQVMLKGRLEQTNIALKERAKVTELDSQTFESQVNKKIRDIENYINNKKTIIKMLRAENSTILAKVRSINNLQKILNMKISEVQAARIRQSKLIRDTNNKGTHQIDTLTNSFMLLTETEKLATKYREDLNLLKESNDAFQLKLEYNNDLIGNFDYEIAQAKRDLKIAEKGKMKFLISILKKGFDCRDKGLTWIIRILWNLGAKIFHEQLPDFLDSLAKRFLLQKASKEQELNDLQTIYKICFEIYKANLQFYKKPQYIEDVDEKSEDDINDSGNGKHMTAEDVKELQARLIKKSGNFHRRDSLKLNKLNSNESLDGLMQLEKIGSYEEQDIIPEEGHHEEEGEDSLSFQVEDLVKMDQKPVVPQLATATSFYTKTAGTDRSNGFGGHFLSHNQIPEFTPEEASEWMAKLDLVTSEYMNSLSVALTANTQPKQTANDIFYSKAKTMVRKYMEPLRRMNIKMKKRPHYYDDPEIMALLQAEEVKEEPTTLLQASGLRDKAKPRKDEDGEDIIEEGKEGELNDIQEPHLVLYDNDIMVNNFANRKEFLEEMNEMKRKAQVIQDAIDEADQSETARVIREFMTKNYGSRFSIDIGTVLSALIGAEKAEREIFRNVNIK